jgi:hypothetical protein
MPNYWRWTLFLLGISFLEVGKTQDLPSKIWQTLLEMLSSPVLIFLTNLSYLYVLSLAYLDLLNKKLVECGSWDWSLLTVDYRIKVNMDLQADKSPGVVKGPFFPRMVNPRYRIRGTMCNTRIQSSKARKAILWRTKLHLI